MKPTTARGEYCAARIPDAIMLNITLCKQVPVTGDSFPVVDVGTGIQDRPVAPAWWENVRTQNPC